MEKSNSDTLEKNNFFEELNQIKYLMTGFILGKYENKNKEELQEIVEQLIKKAEFTEEDLQRVSSTVESVLLRTLFKKL